jgi:hypothetical protein
LNVQGVRDGKAFSTMMHLADLAGGSSLSGWFGQLLQTGCCRASCDWLSAFTTMMHLVLFLAVAAAVAAAAA